MENFFSANEWELIAKSLTAYAESKRKEARSHKLAGWQYRSRRQDLRAQARNLEAMSTVALGRAMDLDEAAGQPWATAR